MWAHQSKLPHFPLPPLSSTLQRFLGALEPVLSAEEHQAYSKAIESYASNEGIRIHAELERINAEAPNWIAGYWQTMSVPFRSNERHIKFILRFPPSRCLILSRYETLRCPLPVNVNPYLLVGADPSPVRERDPILKAAAHLEAIGRFAILIRTGQLKPDMMDPKTPMDMTQFDRILGSTRIPATGRDYVRTEKESRHAVVAVLGQFYSLPLLEFNGTTWSVRPQGQLAQELAALRAHAHSHAARPATLYPVGALTAEDRDRWALVRGPTKSPSSRRTSLFFFHLPPTTIAGELLHTERNRRSLDEIERGLILVCLDETVPAHPAARHAGALLGVEGNRWFDKSLQLIINADGSAAYNMEHTPIDGQTLFRFMVDTWNDVAAQPTPPPVTADLSKVRSPSKGDNGPSRQGLTPNRILPVKDSECLS